MDYNTPSFFSSTKRNDLIFYDSVTRPTGPAMTWGVHTIGFLDIHDQVEAGNVFERSYTVYTHQPFFTWSENQPGTPGAGNFITGAGGFLQSVMNGYAGIRLHFDHLSITNFYNPPDTTALELNGITYLNSRFKLRIMNDTARIQFISVDREHPIKVTLKPSNTVHHPSAGAAFLFSREEELVIEAASNAFGSCEMKETVLGIADAVTTVTTSTTPRMSTTTTAATTTTDGAGVMRFSMRLLVLIILQFLFLY
jgi:hypothetical protein